MNYYITNNGWHDSNELYHYGIKGMKWGVRRYQNPDGSLTAAGKKRAEIDAKKVANARARYNDSVAEFERRLKNSSDPMYINEAFNKTLDAQVRARRVTDKLKSKYANTPISDVTITEKAYNGRKYTAVLMGRTEDSPYDGSPRYQVTAGTWTKSNIWK